MKIKCNALIDDLSVIKYYPILKTYIFVILTNDDTQYTVTDKRVLAGATQYTTCPYEL